MRIMLALLKISNHSSSKAFTELNRVCIAFLNSKVPEDIKSQHECKTDQIKNQARSYEEIVQLNNDQSNGRYTDVYKDMMQGYQGNEHEFAVGREKDILERMEHMDQSAIDRQTSAANLSENSSSESGVNMDIHKHDHSANISLYSVMQSNVPEPYSQDNSPTHMNMPRGGASQRQKYVSGQINDCHPSRRHFSTTTNYYSVQGPQATYINSNINSEPLSVQGVQGDDSAQFKIWLENCHRFNFDCDEQLQGVQTGKKTLSEIFTEQDRLIHQIAMDYQTGKNTIKQNATVIGNQEFTDSKEVVEKLQGKTMKDLLQMEVTPEGVQGMECDHFNIWLQNCSRYGFVNCDEQLQNLQTGKKTLSEIFEEQDRLIRNIAQEYSTNAVSENKSDSAADVKLSQKDRLKRAVKEYGATVVVFHVGISLMSLGGFYLAVSSGLDVVGILGKIGVGQSILESRLATGASTFVVSYAVHKVFAPVRIGITLTSTPFIVRYLRRVGFLKAPKVK